MQSACCTCVDNPFLLLLFVRLFVLVWCYGIQKSNNLQPAAESELTCTCVHDAFVVVIVSFCNAEGCRHSAPCTCVHNAFIVITVSFCNAEGCRHSAPCTCVHDAFVVVIVCLF